MGRRLILLLSAMATMVVVAAGVALAAVLTGTGAAENCTNFGGGPTANADDITLGDGNDTCNGGEGADVIHGDSGQDNLDGGGGTFDDRLYGGGGNGDILKGGSGDDFLNVVDGDDGGGNADDTAQGGPGANDVCAVDDPNEATGCEKVLYARAP